MGAGPKYSEQWRGKKVRNTKEAPIKRQIYLSKSMTFRPSCPSSDALDTMNIQTGTPSLKGSASGHVTIQNSCETSLSDCEAIRVHILYNRKTSKYIFMFPQWIQAVKAIILHKIYIKRRLFSYKKIFFSLFYKRTIFLILTFISKN